MYAADTLLKKAPGCRIDVIDRLPTPFGLVRAGVAPDHQGNKNVTRVFDRTLAKDGVRYLGNVEMGRDVTVEELKSVINFGIGAEFYVSPSLNIIGSFSSDFAALKESIN